MFREIRLKKQQLPAEEALAIIKSATSCVLGVNGDDGYPYTVPVSHAYADGRIYFHCATKGHKLDSINRNDRVSLCVVQQDKVIPEELNTLYRSVIVFGRARILTAEAEKRAAIEKIGERFASKHPDVARKAIEKEWNAFSVVEVTIEHITGKAALELLAAG
jgi:nitroimidazol reductase NimA-like FMN-containing flavoprotein (pyridoxamine 5'-phosphate oxidase superfamily)